MRYLSSGFAFFRHLVSEARVAPRPHPVDAQVGGDPAEPRPYAAFTQFQPRRIAPSLSSVSLRHILGLRIVTKHAPGDGQNDRQVPVDKGAERPRLARRNARKQSCFVLTVIRPWTQSWPRSESCAPAPGLCLAAAISIALPAPSLMQERGTSIAFLERPASVFPSRPTNSPAH